MTYSRGDHFFEQRDVVLVEKGEASMGGIMLPYEAVGFPQVSVAGGEIVQCGTKLQIAAVGRAYQFAYHRQVVDSL